MRAIAAVVAAATLAGIAAPAAAADLLYRHPSDGPDLLEQSNGRAYWVLLSECSGFYGALSNASRDQAESDGYFAQGVEFLRLATARVQADRQVDAEHVNALVSPYVARARNLGGNSLAQDPQASSRIGLTPTMVMTSTCASLQRAYQAATGA